MKERLGVLGRLRRLGKGVEGHGGPVGEEKRDGEGEGNLGE